MKINIKKASLVIIFSIIIIITLSVILQYTQYTRLDVYVKNPNGDIIFKSDVVYKYDGRLSSKYADGIKLGKTIGRVESKGFFRTWLEGPRVYEVKGYDPQKVIFEKALMWDAVYNVDPDRTSTPND